MAAISVILGVLSGVMTLLAGPYRVAMFKFRTFGGVGAGLITWIGIIVFYPTFIVRWPADHPSQFRLTLMYWPALILMGWVQMFAKWCSNEPARDPGSSHSWFGRWEPAFVGGLILFTSPFLAPGTRLFILAGYACSMAQIGIVLLRRRCEAWSQEEGRQIALRTEVATLCEQGGQGVNGAAVVMRSWALSLVPFAAALSRRVKSAFGRPTPDTTDEPVAYRPPTFANRVMSIITAHLVLSFITGAVGIMGLLKGIGFVLTIPAAILIWSLGGEAELPVFVKDEGKAIVERAQEAMEDKRDDVIERARQEQPKWEAKLEEEKREVELRLEAEKRELEMRLAAERARAAEEIERRKRRAVWDFITN